MGQGTRAGGVAQAVLRYLETDQGRSTSARTRQLLVHACAVMDDDWEPVGAHERIHRARLLLDGFDADFALLRPLRSCIAHELTHVIMLR